MFPIQTNSSREIVGKGLRKAPMHVGGLTPIQKDRGGVGPWEEETESHVDLMAHMGEPSPSDDIETPPKTRGCLPRGERLPSIRNRSSFDFVARKVEDSTENRRKTVGLHPDSLRGSSDVPFVKMSLKQVQKIYPQLVTLSHM